jgi:hypothetical protein
MNAQPVGRKLQHFVQQWKQVTGDTWACNLLQNGMTLELTEETFPSGKLEEYPLSQEDSLLLDKEVSDLLDKQAIEICQDSESQTYPDSIYSPLFVVLQKRNKKRPIIDCRHLNSFIVKRHFKMESLLTVRDTLQQGD